MRAQYLGGSRDAARGEVAVSGGSCSSAAAPRPYFCKKVGAPRPKRRTLRWKIPTKDSLLDYALVPVLREGRNRSAGFVLECGA
jgi:hypothetical protein